MNIRFFWMSIIFLVVGINICSSFVGTGAELINSSSDNADYARAEQFSKKTIMILGQGSCPKDEKPSES
jgi:hypothetical protein